MQLSSSILATVPTPSSVARIQSAKALNWWHQGQGVMAPMHMSPNEKFLSA